MSIKLEQIKKYSSKVVEFIKDNPKAFEGGENIEIDKDVPDDRFLFNIVKGNIIVGFIMLVDVSYGYPPYCYEIEIGVFREQRKRGYAVDAINAIKEYCLEYMGKGKLQAIIKKENPEKEAMQHILIKCNFKDIDEFERSLGAKVVISENNNREYFINIRG